MAKGIDYSFARPGGAAIKAAGFSFVCRYLSHDNGKTLDPGELVDLRQAGLDIVLVWESYQNRSLSGWAGGVQDATDALNEANGLGVPSNVVIYFATDFDSTEADDNTIDDYLKGAASVIGAERVGLYGGYWIIKRCADEGTAKWLWQTVAWSGGNVDPRIHIYQNGNGTSLPGTDYDESRQDNFGQWSNNANVAPPQEEGIMNENGVTVIIQAAFRRDPTPEEISYWKGHSFDVCLDNLRNTSEYQEITGWIQQAEHPPAPEAGQRVPVTVKPKPLPHLDPRPVPSNGQPTPPQVPIGGKKSFLQTIWHILVG